MAFLKTGLVFGLIKKVIVAVFKAVYTVLSFFNLHLTVLVGLVGLVLFLTGTFDKYPTVQTGFYIAIIASVIVAIIITIKKLLGLSNKNRKRKGVEIMNTEGAENAETAPAASLRNAAGEAEALYAQTAPPQGGRASENGFQGESAGAGNSVGSGNSGLSAADSRKAYPVYYEVKQNKNYIMAEYADRYVLYFKDRNGLRKIRTDVKRQEKGQTENRW